eukprot:1718883-Amphidinium_carterae.1
MLGSAFLPTDIRSIASWGVSSLFEHIELHVLGCGAKYSAAERARAMAGFASSVATNAAAQRGSQ